MHPRFSYESKQFGQPETKQKIENFSKVIFAIELIRKCGLSFKNAEIRLKWGKKNNKGPKSVIVSAQIVAKVVLFVESLMFILVSKKKEEKSPSKWR